MGCQAEDGDLQKMGGLDGRADQPDPRKSNPIFFCSTAMWPNVFFNVASSKKVRLFGLIAFDGSAPSAAKILPSFRRTWASSWAGVG